MSAKSTPPRRKKKVTAPKVEPQPQGDESEEEELSPDMLALMEQRSFNNPMNAGLASIVSACVAAVQALRNPLPPPLPAVEPARLLCRRHVPFRERLLPFVPCPWLTRARPPRVQCKLNGWSEEQFVRNADTYTSVRRGVSAGPSAT